MGYQSIFFLMKQKTSTLNKFINLFFRFIIQFFGPDVRAIVRFFNFLVDYKNYPPLFGKCLVALLSFFVLFISWNTLGVFIHPFKHDELYFIYSSPHLEGVYLIYLFFMYTCHYLMELLRFNQLWILKVFNFVFALFSIGLIYKIFGFLIKDHKSSIILLFRILSSVFIYSILVYFRGFEVRPEAIANTALLFAYLTLLWSLRWPKILVPQTLALFTSITTLTILPFWSLRYTLISACFLFAFLIRIYQIKRNIIWSLCISTAVVCFLAILVFKLDFLAQIGVANNFQSNREPFGLFQKFTYGEYWLATLSKITILSLVIVYISIKIVKDNHRSNYLHFLYPISLLFCFYFFLFVFDKRPFQYVRSIEWLLLFIIVSWLYINESFSKKYKPFWTSLAVLFLLVSLEGNYKLFKNFNTSDLVDALKNNIGKNEMYQLNPNTLIEIMVQNKNILDQLRSREVFCSKFPNADYFVNSITYHPLCPQTKRREASYLGLLNTKEIKYDFKNYLYFTIPPGRDSIVRDSFLRENFYLYGDVWIKKKPYK